MKIDAVLYDRIKLALQQQLAAQRQMTWKEISAAMRVAVPETDKPGFNWLKVRGVMQAIPNIVRTDNIHTETYVWKD